MFFRVVVIMSIIKVLFSFLVFVMNTSSNAGETKIYLSQDTDNTTIIINGKKITCGKGDKTCIKVETTNNGNSATAIAIGENQRVEVNSSDIHIQIDEDNDEQDMFADDPFFK